MSLLHPGAGDLHDRLAILLLKIKYGQKTHKPTEHFESEYKAIRSLCNGVYDHAAFDRLVEINEGIWLATERLRRASTVKQKAEIADQFLTLNDQRASLVRRLNLEHGDTRPPEKIS